MSGVDISSHIEALDRDGALLAEFFNPLGLEELCIGGGLGVPYVAGESAPTLTEWAATLPAGD